MNAQSAERQVGPSDVSSTFGFYSTSPENISGTLLCYVTYKKDVTPDSSRQIGELWVCSTELTDYRKVTDITGFSPHDGAEASWMDDENIVFRDYQPDLRTSLIRVVNVHSGEDAILPVVGATTLGHAPHGTYVLFNIAAKDGVHKSRSPGIYELDTVSGEVRPVFLQEDEVARVLEQLPVSAVREGLLPPRDWQCLHSQYSPNGKRILFRLDVGESEDSWLVASCDIEGKDLVIMTSEPNHLLHALWYDNNSIVAHDREGAHWTQPGVLKTWQIGANNGTPIGLPGNHLAMSPDRKAFASETGYNSNPVVLRYFATGTDNIEDASIITESYFPEITWGKSFHINPSFSRDGKRLYYNKPLDRETNGTFVSDL